MKKPQNPIITRLKTGKVKKTKSAIRARSAGHGAEAVKNSSRIGYSDALIEVYNQEEKDIRRFAAFAKTLITK